jgi:hypothetical protein
VRDVVVIVAFSMAPRNKSNYVPHTRGDDAVRANPAHVSPGARVPAGDVVTHVPQRPRKVTRVTTSPIPPEGWPLFEGNATHDRYLPRVDDARQRIVNLRVACVWTDSDIKKREGFV